MAIVNKPGSTGSATKTASIVTGSTIVYILGGVALASVLFGRQQRRNPRRRRRSRR